MHFLVVVVVWSKGRSRCDEPTSPHVVIQVVTRSSGPRHTVPTLVGVGHGVGVYAPTDQHAASVGLANPFVAVMVRNLEDST
jgi:hypothetical protein